MVQAGIGKPASPAFDLSIVSHLRRAGLWRPLLLAAIAILAIEALVAISADWIVPHDPTRAVLVNKHLPPFWQERGNLSYPLGTDSLGRDILSRIMLGARASLWVAAASILVGGTAGTVLGLLAGYHGKRLDAVTMRVVDGMLAFPAIFLALLLAVVVGSSVWNLILVISLVLSARFARLVRGEVLVWKTRDFIALARSAGASPFRIVLRHILPNILNTVVVLATLQVGWVIQLEASLSFLGAGVPPPTPAWGLMVAEGREYIATAWWIAAFPGFAILLTIIAVNLLGDWLRDALDPKLRQI